MLIVGSSEFNGNPETVHNEERQTQRQVGTMIEHHLNQVHPLDPAPPGIPALDKASCANCSAAAASPCVMVICL